MLGIIKKIHINKHKVLIMCSNTNVIYYNLFFSVNFHSMKKNKIFKIIYVKNMSSKKD